MELIIKGDTPAQILSMVELIATKGQDLSVLRNQCKTYADQAAASASRADTAARNAEMAAGKED